MSFTKAVLANNLRTLRSNKHYDERRDVTQKEVANACGVEVATYASYERGTSAPNYEKAWLLADYFGVTLDELGGREMR